MPQNSLLALFGLLVCLAGYTSAFEITAPAAAVNWLQEQNFRFRPIFAVAMSAAIPRDGVEAPLWIQTSTPALGCTPLPADAAGKIVVLKRGSCAFQDKGSATVAGGGLAMVVYNSIGNTQADSLAMQGNGTILSIVCESLSLFEGNILVNLTLQYGPLTARILQLPAPDVQKQALIELYNKTGGLGWSYNGLKYETWRALDTDPCSTPWQSVTCTVAGDITILSLGSSGITGTIPDSFRVLTGLTILSFSGNSLYGTLPDFLGTFNQMEQFDIHSNNFTGTIPASLQNWTSLQSLDLSVNELTGTVPPAMWNFPLMEGFVLENNRLTGTLPPLFTTTKAYYFDISDNQFSGQFSDTNMTSLPLLYFLDVSRNKFTGTIPPWLGQVTKLSSLQLAGNEFVGTIPSTFLNLTNLALLDISANLFEGDFPDLNLPPKLRTFKAAHNMYNSIPPTFVSHTTLTNVDFSYNNINVTYTSVTSRLPVPSGQQAIDAGNCLQYIDISHNKIFTATLAYQFGPGLWQSLVSFKMNDNLLTKTFQIVSSANPYLKTVDFSNNRLSGTIPDQFSVFGALTELNLANNSFSYSPVLGNTLPTNFVPSTTKFTYFAQQHMNCPTIILQPAGIEVEMDPYYHGYELCQCEQTYRRVVDYVPNANTTLPLKAPPFTCVLCQEGLNCAYNRSSDLEFLVKPYYWATPSRKNPEYLIPCPNCDGDNATGIFNCAPNHQGRLCAQCKSGTFLRGTTCEKCAPIGSVVIVVSIIVLIALVVGFTMFTLIQRQLCGICFLSLPPVGSTFFSHSRSAESVSQQQGILNKERVSKSSSIAALLIAINYYQTVSALSQYYDLPVSVTQLLSAVKIVTSVTGAGLGMECLSDELQYYHNMYTAIMLEPVLLLGAVFLVYAFGKIYMISAARVPTILHEWEITCLKMALFVINLLFFPITNTTINAFRCSEDPATGVMYNTQYPYEECNAVPLVGRVLSLLIYSVGVMFLFSALIFIYLTKSNGDDRPGSIPYIIQKSFGFFFLHLRDRYFWFSILILLRRFLISLITSLVPVNSVLSFGLNNMVLVVSALVVLIKRPFRTHIDNLLEVSTILCAILIYGMAVLMAFPDFSYGAIVIEIFYFLINIAVILWCGFEFLRTNFPIILSYWRNHQKKKAVIGVSEASQSSSNDPL